MKATVSLPDQIFYEAEAAAKCRDITRSKLYLNALIEYLQKNNHKNITEKLNAVYTDDYYQEFESMTNANLENMRGINKNDAR
jgi:metal-responsive CopG/Arc/MetJ family transcriptional regulator